MGKGGPSPDGSRGGVVVAKDHYPDGSRHIVFVEARTGQVLNGKSGAVTP
jgi:hypothetical protein